MSLDFEEINQRRDRKLRYLLLSTLYLSRGKFPSGGLSGARLIEWTTPAIEMSGLAFETDEHAIQLINDLRDRGYVEVTVSRNRKVGEYVRLSHLNLVKITAKGADLHEWAIDPDPQVDDGRGKD